MNIIDIIFGTLFGILMRYCYLLTDSFGWAIIIFTFLTKAVLFPISLVSQKNSIVMVKIQPELADLQLRYEGEPDILLKEQKLLYKNEGYSTLKAVLPLLLQIPLIIGVISVVNNPAKHIGKGITRDFLGLDLLALPENMTIPALAIFSTMLLCVVQNLYNVISREQSFAGKWGVTIFLVAFTGWFSLSCPAGVGLYWVFSNLFGVLVLAVCNLIYSPKKYIDYENRSAKYKPTKAEKDELRKRRKLEKLQEKDDLKRFFLEKKELVFYSESSGFYKYFKHFIDYILENSDIIVHYLTSDINDQVFRLNNPKIIPYFCTPNGLISTFMKMDADIVVMTMPDLDVYHYKRSLVKKDIEYIYTDHGEGSYHLMLRKGALDHYDTIFCYSKNHNEEIRAMERVYGSKEKKLVNVGFGLLDMLIENYTNSERPANNKSQILIAPSWQKDNILECCLDPLLQALFLLESKIIIRPHPEFVKRFPGKMSSIIEKYNDKIGENFEIQTDFSSNSTVYNSDLVITDWSSIALEFSFTTKKPSLFINTPMKVMNIEWHKVGIEPMELWIREKIGVCVDVADLDAADSIVKGLLQKSEAYRDSIGRLVDEYMYNLGDSSSVGGRYIIEQINRKRVYHHEQSKNEV